MTRALAGAGITLSLAFALAVAGLRLLPLDETVSAFFGDCAARCWQDVQPGVTARTDALAGLKVRGWRFDNECNAAVYNRCYTFIDTDRHHIAYLYIEQERVVQIALVNSGMTLGDVWLTFGAPDYAAIPVNPGSATTFFTSLWFGSAGISTRMGVPCPAKFPDVLRSRINTILVWEPGTAMRGTVIGTMTDLRQTLRRICSG
ncbi:MAG: hypothetical protein U0521_20785 [Anaerolineae bacterium]